MRTICCEDYSLVNPPLDFSDEPGVDPTGRVLDEAPTVPDELSGLPEEALPAEYRIPYNKVQDYPSL